MITRSRLVAVAIHDVEPATFRRCAAIRAWLAERGIDRATLLVIPAADLHDFADRSPALRDWLLLLSNSGDAVAQHGLKHSVSMRPPLARRLIARWQGGEAAEFPGLSPSETSKTVEMGRSILAATGIEVHGFVAPGYAYTRALRGELDERFDWWSDLFAVHLPRVGRRFTSPAVGLGCSTPLKRLLSPPTARALSLAGGRLARLDVHPGDFDHPRLMRALERTLKSWRNRDPVTYDDLVGIHT